VQRLERVTPTFTPSRVLHVNAEHVLVAGTVGRASAVAKCARPGPDGEVRAPSLVEEIGVNRALVRERPPVRAPKLLSADLQAGILLVERVPGPLAAQYRHPGHAPARDLTLAVLGAVVRLNTWRPAADRFPARVDYPREFARLHRVGLIPEADLHPLQRLLRDLASSPPQFCHGQPFLTNVILSPSGPVLVDWAEAGWYLPGHDLAALWMTLGCDSAARRQISRLAAGAGTFIRDGFLVNLLLLLAREVRRLDVPTAREEQRALVRSLRMESESVRRAVRAAATSD
jgi:hypothetical protein